MGGVKSASTPALYLFNKGDYNAIISALNEINWDTVFDSKGTLACYEYFNDRIYELYNCSLRTTKEA